MCGNVLYKTVSMGGREVKRILVPPEVMGTLITLTHEYYLHVGFDKCYQLLCERFTCPGLRRMVKLKLRHCLKCQLNKSSKTAESIEKFIQTSHPLSHVFIDFLGSFPSSGRNRKYILTCVDGFTKYVKLYATTFATTNQALLCVRKFIQQVGKPSRIITDNATIFTSASWKIGLLEMDIAAHLTPVKHPQSNLAERVNYEVIKYLRIMIGDRQPSWFWAVQDIEDIINSTHHTQLKMSPYEAFHNKKPRRPWDILPDPCGDERDSYDVWIAKLKNIHQSVNEVKIEKLNQKREPRSFLPNDLVLVKATHQSSHRLKKNAKLCPRFIGPYKVITKLGSNCYALGNSNDKIRGVYHASFIKHYYNPSLVS
uniref:RNA-directed DNA polymerase n=2 Tax=Lygus hesperus TaxID=30085 RepID=A0A0K8TC94_LYGHE